MREVPSLKRRNDDQYYLSRRTSSTSGSTRDVYSKHISLYHITVGRHARRAVLRPAGYTARKAQEAAQSARPRKSPPRAEAPPPPKPLPMAPPILLPPGQQIALGPNGVPIGVVVHPDHGGGRGPPPGAVMVPPGTQFVMVPPQNGSPTNGQFVGFPGSPTSGQVVPADGGRARGLAHVRAIRAGAGAGRGEDNDVDSYAILADVHGADLEDGRVRQGPSSRAPARSAAARMVVGTGRA